MEITCCNSTKNTTSLLLTFNSSNIQLKEKYIKPQTLIVYSFQYTSLNNTLNFEQTFEKKRENKIKVLLKK